MKKTDLLYGEEHWEILETGDPEDALNTVIENACDTPGEGFDSIAERIEWPVRILEFARRQINHNVDTLAQIALEAVLECLDEEYAGSDADEASTPTDKMKTAAEALGKAVHEDYVPWTCEPNGNVHEYTRDEARKILA